VLPQSGQQHGTRPNGKRKSFSAQPLSLTESFVVQLRWSDVGGQEQHKSAGAFAPPMIRVFEKIVAGLADERRVTSLVALALTDEQQPIVTVDQEIDTILTLTSCSVSFDGVNVSLSLRQISTQILERILTDAVEGWNSSRPCRR
jgi:hypothetical protein